MDQELFERWKEGRPPFDEAVLRLDDLLPVHELRAALRNVVDDLKRTLGEPVLIGVEDWHEHDGYITSGRATTWSEIDRALESDELLYDARHTDAYVHRAFYVAGGRFLLRFDLLEKDEDELYPGLWGTFDLSASQLMVEEILKGLPDQVRLKVVVEGAKQYFDRNYAG
jgi:hypothetical protein